MKKKTLKIMPDTPYVYVLKNPLKNDAPFYVGKGRNYRFQHHFSKCMLENNTYKTHLITKILSHNMLPDIEIIYCGSDEEALDLEAKLIEKYKKISDGGILVNILDGGDNPPKNSGSDHPQFGKSGKFLLTNLNSGLSIEVVGIYHWAKKNKLNGRTLVEIADSIPCKKPNGKTIIRKQHKGWICKRIY